MIKDHSDHIHGALKYPDYSLASKDTFVLAIHHDPSDLVSLILIIPNECTFCFF